MEALMGTISIVIDEEKKMIGIGSIICFQLLKYYFDQAEIKLTRQNIFNPKTRLKELYERKEGFNGHKWKLDGKGKPGKDNTDHIVTREVYNENNRIFHTIVYGWPKGTMERIEKNRDVLGEGKHKIKIQSQFIAMEEAIKSLKKYGIYEKEDNPYKRVN
jgi:hypothetical protein